MATLKCLACGQDNRVGEEACARCSSSLNLRLCSGCEAINDHTADQCHSCGEAFANDVSAPTAVEEPPAAMDPPRAEPTRVETRKVQAPLRVAMVEEPSAPGLLPTRRLIDSSPRRAARVAQVAVLWTGAAILGVGGAYGFHRYQVSGWPAVSGWISPQVVAAPKPSVASAPVSPVMEQAPAPAAEPKAASAPVSPNIAQSSAAQATARVEPKRNAVPVTHTRAGSANVETQPAASASAPVVPRARVTPTRAPVPGEAGAAAASVPAAAIQAPIEKPMNPNPPACAPGVAALGLCLAK